MVDTLWYPSHPTGRGAAPRWFWPTQPPTCPPLWPALWRCWNSSGGQPGWRYQQQTWWKRYVVSRTCWVGSIVMDGFVRENPIKTDDWGYPHVWKSYEIPIGILWKFNRDTLPSHQTLGNPRTKWRFQKMRDFPANRDWFPESRIGGMTPSTTALLLIS